MRPRQIRARCSSVCATSIVVAPWRRHIVTTLSNSAVTSAAGPSSSTISTVSASGKFGWTAASAARIASESIISTAAGMMPGADDLGDHGAARVDRVERGQQRLHRFRPPQNPHGHAGDDGERAFRADDEAEQIGARRVGERAAQLDQLAVGQHRLDPEHVMNGEAVLEAMRAAGVLGDVAADRAHLLARRIRRVVVAERRDPPGDVEIGDARLHRHPLVRDVDIEDAVEAGQGDHEPAGDRQRAARQTGAVAARDERDPGPRAEPHDRLHFRRGRGQHDRRRRFAQMGQRVALVGQQLERILEDVRVADNPPQFGQKRVIHVLSGVRSGFSRFGDICRENEKIRDLTPDAVSIIRACERSPAVVFSKAPAPH